MEKQSHLLWDRKQFMVLLFFLFEVGIHAQEKAIIDAILYESERNTDAKIVQVDSLIRILETGKKDSLEYIYHDYAYWLYNRTSIQNVIDTEKKALALANSKAISDSILLQRIHRDLGYYYDENNQIFKSIQASNDAILINPNAERTVPILYLALGHSYFKTRDYFKAIKYFEIAADLISKIDSDKKDTFLHEAYQNIILICLDIGSSKYLKKGRQYGKKTTMLLRNNDLISDTDRKNMILNKWQGDLYNEEIKYKLLDNRNNIEKLVNVSSKYYSEALKLAIKTNDTTEIISNYVGLSGLYNLFDKEKSIRYAKNILPYNIKNDDFIYYQVYNNISVTQSLHKKYSESLKNKHKALEYLIGQDFQDISKTETAIPYDISDEQVLKLIETLPQLAQIYQEYYTTKKDTAFLEKSLTYFKIADRLVNKLKINSNDFNSRLFWRKLTADIYGKAIRVSYLKEDYESAFYFMEKNKALLLLEDISDAAFKRSIQIPISIKQKEIAMHKNIVAIDRLLKENEKQTPKRDSLKQQRIQLNIELARLGDSLGIRDLKIDPPSILPLKTIQNYLNDDQVLVEYHISNDDGYSIYTNNDRGYALFVTNKEIKFFEIDNLDYLKEQVTTLINSFRSPFQTQHHIDQFNHLSNAVYDQLFPSEEIKQLIKNKMLTIAPDGFLSLLPFEALSVVEDKTSYLIYNTEINYIYSNSFVKAIEKPTSSGKIENLAVAPINFEDDNLNALDHSIEEINSIKKYYSSSSLLKNEASKENFLKALDSPLNGIIHIASHANAENRKTPWIALNDEKITLEELYLTENDASLVVLSGCNTSVGEQEVGEGVMSLARGFFYSGAQSVVSSLWSIDDRSTSEIINSFYKNLSQGQTKSTALHNAKLKYLANHKLSETSPYYWASLVLLGKNDTLIPAKPPIGLYLVALLFLIGGIYFLIKRK